MTASIGIRDIVRNTSILDEYDMVEIEDKKTKKRKGLFVSSKYADDVKHFIEAKERENRKKRLAAFMQFSGSMSSEESFEGLESDRWKELVAKRKAGE